MLSEETGETITLPSIHFNVDEDFSDDYYVTHEFEEPKFFDCAYPVTLGSQIKAIDGCYVENDELVQILQRMVNLEKLDFEARGPGFQYSSRTQPKAENWYSKQYAGIRVLPVKETANMKQVVEEAGIAYKQGKGYYQVTKKESVTEGKGVIVIDEQDQILFFDDDSLAEIGIVKKSKYDLNVKEGYVTFVQSTSHSRKLPKGSYVMYDTDQLAEGQVDPRLFVNVPMLKHVKDLSLSGPYTTDKFAAKMICIMPNIEEFRYVYNAGPTDAFIRFLADHAPKLRVLTIEGDNAATPAAGNYTDEGLLYLLSKTKLERLHIANCGSISGQLFSEMSSVAQHLTYLSIDKNSMEGGNFVAEPSHIQFTGEMPNMRELYLGGDWILDSDLFYDSIITVMPNLKKVTFEIDSVKKQNVIKLIRSLDLEQVDVVNLFDSGSVYHRAESEHDEDARKQIVSALQQKKKLKSIACNSVVLFTLEELQQSDFSSVTVWEGRLKMSIEYLEVFHKVFPNLVKMDCRFVENDEDSSLLTQFLRRDNVWPDLEKLELRYIDVKRKVQSDTFVAGWLKYQKDEENY